MTRPSAAPESGSYAPAMDERELPGTGPAPARAGRAGRARTLAVALLVGLLSLAAFRASPVTQLVDSNYSMLLSESLLLHGSFRLDRYFWPHVDSRGYPEVAPGGTLPRHVKPVGEHLYYHFPPGTSVLSAPLVAVLRAAGLSSVDARGRFDPRGEELLQRWVAAAVSGACCAVFFLLARRVLPEGPSVLAALAGGFATQVWSTASRATWSHTWMLLLLSLALLCLLAAEQSGRFRPVVFATLVAASFFVRPLAAAWIAPLSLYALLRHRRQALALAVAGALWLGAFFVLNALLYGEPWSGYFGRGERFRTDTVGRGLYAALLSPSRGLLVYVPLSLLALGLVAAHLRRLPHRGLALAALAAFGAHLTLVSFYFCWWTGVSYGARYTADMVPVLLLLGVLGARAARARGGAAWRAAVALFWLLLVPGAVLNGAGALSESGMSWNARPVPLRAEPERVLDWSNPQFLAALFPGRLEPPRAAGDEPEPVERRRGRR